MITVADALALDVFENAETVAGADGLPQTIQWIHIVDQPEYGPWVESGVLVLTTAFGIKDSCTSQVDLVSTLAQEGVVGLVIGLTKYFEQVPDQMIALANELHFPIITVPYGVRFIDLTRALFDRILSEQYHLLKKTTEIHDTLTGLVLEGKDFPALAQALATLLQRPVVFEDARFRLLGSASLDRPVDSARLDSIAQAQTSPSIIAALQDAGVFDQIRASGRPMRVPPFPELGMTMERIAAPINVDGETLAYVWIIADDRPLEDLDRRAIERAATVAALIMLRDKEVRAAEQRMRESFMHRLLSGTADDVCALADQATRLGLDADCPHQMIVLQFDGPPPAALSNLSYRLDQTARQQSRATFVTCRGDHLVAICECGNARDATPLAKHLIEELDDIDVPARVGIGRACGSLADLHVSYRQAKDTLRIGRVFAPEERVLEFDNLGLLYWLDQLPDDVIPLNSYAQSVETLVEADAVHSVDLRHTLEAYLDTGGCVKEAARGLYIHRNTLYHRLHRIQSICDLDLKDPSVRVNLHVALKNYRLHSAS